MPRGDGAADDGARFAEYVRRFLGIERQSRLSSAALESLAIKAERILRRVGIHSKERNVELRVHPQLAVHIFEQYGKRLEQLERQYRYKIDVRDDPRIFRDEIRVIFPRTNEDVTEKFAT